MFYFGILIIAVITVHFFLEAGYLKAAGENRNAAISFFASLILSILLSHTPKIYGPWWLKLQILSSGGLMLALGAYIIRIMKFKKIKRVHQGYIDEMLNCAGDAGIVLQDFYPLHLFNCPSNSYDKKSEYPDIKNAMLAVSSLEKAKKNGTYTIKWHVCDGNKIPQNAILIGKVANPQYAQQLKNYSQQLAAYRQIQAKYDIGLAKLKADLQPKIEEKYLKEMEIYTKSYDDWVTTEYSGRECPICSGAGGPPGVIPSQCGGADYTCEACNGSGYLFSPEYIKEQYCPQKPKLKTTRVEEEQYRESFNYECALQGINYENPDKPDELLDIYIEFVQSMRPAG